MTPLVSNIRAVSCMLYKISSRVIHPFENSYAWGMTLCYSVFMTMVYFTIKKLSESFAFVK